MKKLTSKRKAHLLQKQRRADRRRRKARKRTGERPGAAQARSSRQRARRIQRAPVVELAAPAVFSLVENPVEVIRFLNRIEETTASGSNVNVNLRDVTALTADAAAVLLSRVNDRRYSHDMEVAGRGPLDPTLSTLLIETGFYDHVNPIGPRPKTNGVGQIRTRKSFKVDAASSAELVRQVLAIVPGGEFERDGIQRAIVESMTNTENHAGRRRHNQERWWLSAHCDRQAGVARFCFFDNGVGIFQSLKRKGLWSQIKRVLGRDDPADFLRKILAGQVQSSTGLNYRGKGLPMIARAHQRNQFRRLVILSNSVYADVEADEFRTLPVPFSGTLLYWEHHER